MVELQNFLNAPRINVKFKHCIGIDDDRLLLKVRMQYRQD